MRPVDYDPSQDPQDYLDALTEWETIRDQLVNAQTAASADLVAAQARLSTLTGWAATLQIAVSEASAHVDQLAANTAERARIDAELPELAQHIEDHEAAREVGTARLLGGPDNETPLVLLPLRLQTRWLDGTLHVRIYPDDVSVDAHDPTLTADELTWATHFWEVYAAAATDPEETWQQLVRRFGPTRAAWLVLATRPDSPPPKGRDTEWPQPPVVRLLPDRFAVVALADGVPIDVASPGEAPRFVTWSARVVEPLRLPAFDADAVGGTAWWSDLAAARAAGMAVAITVPADAPPIEALVVLGVRSGAGGLGELLSAHSVSSGVELLAAGTATNNSAAVRSAHSPRAQELAARAVRDSVLHDQPQLGEQTGGGRIARLLGVPGTGVAALAGATVDGTALVNAARLVVGLGAQGALRRRLGPGTDGLWSWLEPGGSAPAVRIGRQPYGVLPATAPGRWRPRDGEAGAGLAGALGAWAAATGPAVRTDPAAPPPGVGGGPARHVTLDDDAELATLLLESASSVGWTDGSAVTADGLDGLVGPTEGDTSAATVLPVVAATAVADLASLPVATRTGSLLARIAVAAKRAAPSDRLTTVDTALSTLASADRSELARVVAEFLDTASHRFDTWVTAAATERLDALRRTHPGNVAVGAFGWLTDVAPRVLPRSFGHVHAPSLAQASTAAVLRSGYLGERRRAWTALVRQAEADVAAAPGDEDARRRLDKARAGRDALLPLEPAAERRLSLAVDLSSHRMRDALWVLAAVRAGQPLAAVLGYQFERDLTTAGLPQYLSALRKLTRFRTGTALEQVELQLQDRRHELALARSTLASLQQAAAELRDALEAARAAEQAAQVRYNRAVDAYVPYHLAENERADAADTVTELTIQLAAHDANRPLPAHHTFHVRLP